MRVRVRVRVQRGGRHHLAVRRADVARVHGDLGLVRVRGRVRGEKVALAWLDLGWGEGGG